MVKNYWVGSPAVAKWVKNLTAVVEVQVQFPAWCLGLRDPALLQLWHRSQLWLTFNAWPGNFHMPQAQAFKKERERLGAGDRDEEIEKH